MAKAAPLKSQHLKLLVKIGLGNTKKKKKKASVLLSVSIAHWSVNGVLSKISYKSSVAVSLTEALGRSTLPWLKTAELGKFGHF